MNDNKNSLDRRDQPRFPLRAYAQLAYSSREWEAHILDMSMTGARVALLGEHLLRAGDRINLAINCEDNGMHDSHKKNLWLHGVIKHIREHILGIEYRPATEIDKQLLVSFLAQTTEE